MCPPLSGLGIASLFSIAYTASPLYWLCLQVQHCLYSQPTICTGSASKFSVAYTASPLFVLALPPSSALPIQPAHYLYWLYLQVQHCLYSQPTICTGSASKFSIAYTASPLFVLALPPSSVLPIQPAHYLYWLCLQVQYCLYSQPTICTGSASKFSIAYTASPLFVLALPQAQYCLYSQPTICTGTASKFSIAYTASPLFVLALPQVQYCLPIQPAHYLYWHCLKFSVAYTASPLLCIQ